MNKLFYLLLFISVFEKAQINKNYELKEIKIDSQKYTPNKILLDTIIFIPKYSIPIKQNKNFKPFGKMYRDNFTGRMYFQKGFDRTLIYSK
ncbi:hypothetical protein [Elizabethkingia anophelis]|jgi:hypothetical protein|uniref:hypothetical protein n=1 Tax=Elizabethkingia anophelis TaxID=1117645 RepID=UPI00042A8DA6|nr:hypothetical protein [Elizabethkingia anophelis]